MLTTFHRARTIDEAVTLKRSLGKRACFLAGGTSVNSSDSTFAGDCAIGLAGLGLDGIRTTAGNVTLGACCTFTQVLNSAEAPAPVKAAIRHVVNRNIRNVATLGGHIATNKSCGDLLPVLVTLEAAAETVGPDAPTWLSVQECLGLEEMPLITSVKIPKPAGGRVVVVDRYSRTANDISILTVAVALSRDGNLIRNPIIAAGGVAPHVARLRSLEGKLAGGGLPDQDEIEKWVAAEVAPVSDIRGSEVFKRYRAGVLVAMAVRSAYLDPGDKTR